MTSYNRMELTENQKILIEYALKFLANNADDYVVADLEDIVVDENGLFDEINNIKDILN